MKNSIFKKLIVFTLAFVMVVTYIPLTENNVSVADAATGFEIFYGGEPCESLTVDQKDSKTLTAESLGAGAKYQWQVKIKDTEDSWVNIRGSKGKKCNITYALVGSMLDNTGKASVRCVAKKGDVEYTSEPVEITISYNIDSTPGSIKNASPSADAGVYAIKSRGIKTFALSKAAAEYVTITIEYMFEGEDGEPDRPAFDPYIASLRTGTDFKTMVPSPTILGFNAYVKEGDTYKDASSVSLDYKNISENQKITVYYRPAEVGYKVRYFLQNISDDMYTEDTSLMVSDTGFTGDYPKEELVKKNIDGFNALYYQPETIAADGSTEFQCYYDRNYYLINFDLNGGFGVDPIYARFQTPFVVNTPVKPGYVFGGWDLEKADGTYDGVADTMVSTIPNANLKYKAIWNAVETTYTIVYWRENADDNNYSYWGSRQVDAMSATTVSGLDDVPTSISNAVVDGETLNEKPYFTYNDVMTDKNVIVEGDGSTIVNVYYTRNYYTINFTNLSGKCGLEEHTHGDGTCEYQYLCKFGSHTHTAECLSCELEENPHIDTCCVYNEHTHNECSPDNCTHVHTVDCYSTDNNRDLVKMNSAPNLENYEDAGNGIWTRKNSYYGYTYYTYYVNINGEWYSGRNDWNNNSDNTVVITYNCQHSHSDSCYSCENIAHTHDVVSCDYSGCTDPSHHEHNDDCYKNCTNGSHTHTDACLGTCIKQQHTHTNSNPNCDVNSKSNIIYSITAKYNQEIADIWPTSEMFPTLRGWDIEGVSNQAVSKRVNMTEDLCDTSDRVKRAVAEEADGNRTLHYMFESFDQASPANGTTRQLRNGKYYDSDPRYYQVVRSNNTFSQKQIMGMSPVEVVNNSNPYVSYLYYNRTRHNISFQNVSEVVKTVGNIMYEQPLENYRDGDGNLLREFTPEYPTTYEPNAYKFDGWYTTPGCYPGTEYNWTGAEMPNGNLMLYAKWAPVQRTVKFYQQYSDIETGNPLDGAEFTVDHGDVLNISTDIEVEAPGEDRTFAGWFYMKDGEKIAFNPYEMAVKADLDVFAEWTSSIAAKYEIRYVDKDTNQEIAPPLSGITFAGQTKTFAAKSGMQLNEGYRNGYFPETNSHSIVISEDAENGEISDNNKYTFYYVKLDEVPYTVRYVNKQTGEVWDTVVKQNLDEHDNRVTVITEKFKAYSGYIPDAYYKRLVLSATPSENVITFYYLEDNEHAYYVVYHKIEELDGTYSDYAVIEGIGDIDKTITASPLSITGFTFNKDAPNTKVQGSLTIDGLELYLYYDRNTYDYTVRYLEYGTDDKKVKDSKTVSGAKYEEVVTETTEASISKDGNIYEIVGDPIKKYQIRDGENVITFYYKLRQYTIKYEAVCTEPAATDYGSVTFNQQIVNNSSQITGSEAISEDGYRFIGWYSDPSCKDEFRIADTAFFRPTELSDATYYALFEPIITELTIVKAGVKESDSNQNFIFNVKGNGSNGYIDMDVVVTGNGSKTISEIPEGEYTITEKTNWSWRYDFDSTSGSNPKIISVKTSTSPNKVTFTNKSNGLTWLGGEKIRNNKFN